MCIRPIDDMVAYILLDIDDASVIVVESSTTFRSSQRDHIVVTTTLKSIIPFLLDIFYGAYMFAKGKNLILLP